MRIDGLNSAPLAQLLRPAAPAAQEPAAANFADLLQSSIAQTNGLQSEADSLVLKVASGDLAATQQAIVAMEKAGLALDLTVQVRNKIIEAYQDLMRTQV